MRGHRFQMGGPCITGPPLATTLFFMLVCRYISAAISNILIEVIISLENGSASVIFTLREPENGYASVIFTLRESENGCRSVKMELR